MQCPPNCNKCTSAKKCDQCSGDGFGLNATTGLCAPVSSLYVSWGEGGGGWGGAAAVCRPATVAEQQQHRLVAAHPRPATTHTAACPPTHSSTPNPMSPQCVEGCIFCQASADQCEACDLGYTNTTDGGCARCSDPRCVVRAAWHLSRGVVAPEQPRGLAGPTPCKHHLQAPPALLSLPAC
jgi:hypothetical protein